MDAAARRTLHDDLVRLRDGDRAAARPVFDALWPVVLGLARGLLHDDAAAQDAAQQALVTLFHKAAAFDDRRSALGWALALTTWECRTQRSRRARRKEDAIETHEGATGSPPRAPQWGVWGARGVEESLAPDLLIHAEEVARVASAFTTLGEADQATLRALLDGEAAGDATARKRRQRALDRLRALVFGDSHG